MDSFFQSCCAGIYKGGEEEEQPVIEIVEKSDTEKVAECQEKYKIGDSKVQEYKKSFRMLDKDGNGKLDTTELGNAMHFWGENPTMYEIQKLIKKYDADKNGTVDFPEYLVMMVHRQKESKTEKVCLTAFLKYDSNRNGYISLDDTKKGLDELKLVCSEKNLKEIAAIVDKNSAKELNYSQVVKLLRKKGILASKDGI